jgi:hypothetical protein
MKPTARLVAALKGKHEWWLANHEIHSGSVTGPWPHGERFVVGFQYDVTNKPSGKRITPPFTESVKLVPPTPITKGSEDSYSAWRGPVELCPVPSGFEPASPLETNTFTPAAASRKNNRFR